MQNPTEEKAPTIGEKIIRVAEDSAGQAPPVVVEADANAKNPNEAVDVYAKKIHDAAVKALAGIAAEDLGNLDVATIETWHLRLAALYALVNSDKATLEKAYYKFLYENRHVSSTRGLGVTAIERMFFTTPEGERLIFAKHAIDSIHEMNMALAMRQKRLSQPFAT